MESHFSGSKVPDRVFFIVDRTRLMQETDELKDAIVVYRPENDLKKVSSLNSQHVVQCCDIQSSITVCV